MVDKVVNKTRTFSDLDLNFMIHPVKKDINKKLDANAVITSIRNLVLTNHYERPFQPGLGSNLRRMLFENVDPITATLIEREIAEVINNFEPRVNLLGIVVEPNIDENAFNVRVSFTLLNTTAPIIVRLLLQRTR
jgi:phage baseplate assembly protein W